MATKAIVKYRNRTVIAKRARRKAQARVPLAVIGGFVPILFNTYNGYKENGVDGATQNLVAFTTGYSRWEGKFKAEYLIKGMAPVVIGMMVHKLVGGKLGLNRAIARAGIPYLSI